MAHLVRDKEKLLARVRRIQGQLKAVERSLEAEAECGDTLQLIVSSRGALNGLMAEVLEGHLRHHVARPISDPASAEARDLEQAIDVVRAYLR